VKKLSSVCLKRAASYLRLWLWLCVQARAVRTRMPAPKPLGKGFSIWSLLKNMIGKVRRQGAVVLVQTMVLLL
jgi:hypothetical protein